MGKVISISGYLAKVEGLNAHLYDLVKIEDGSSIYGEVIKIKGNISYVQLFSFPTSLGYGAKAVSLAKPLEILLGPHLVDNVFDGTMNNFGDDDFYTPFLQAPKRSKFPFTPSVKKGARVVGGSILGSSGKLSITAPPNTKGKVIKVYEGKFSVYDAIAELDDGSEIYLAEKWPIRKARPFKRRLSKTVQMETGIRAVDSFLPIKKGGVAIIPGPFGSGKTVFQESLAFN
ncbi:MAG: hypothetical protein D6769_00530, partial [Methanobacteriota archaeon]